MKKVYIGTSGFLYSHWIGDFYPSDLKREQFLQFYAKHFNTVEINSSFYHIPRQQTVLIWKKQTPDNFIFAFKMSRFVSHFAKLDPKVKSFNLFFEALKPFFTTPPKHLILIQTPSSFKINIAKLKDFLNHLPQTFFYAFEFRHGSWFCKDVYQLLKKINAAVVLADSPIKKTGVETEGLPPARKSVNSERNFTNNQNNVLSSNQTQKTLPNEHWWEGSRDGPRFFRQRLWPYVNINTASFFYIRFHGSKRLFASSYTDEELKFYASLIKEKLKNGLNVYCYFNNDAEGAAIFNAKRLKSFLKMIK